MFVGLVDVLAFWGMNLMDGGFVLAQGHRLLAGEVPHEDFITPRPAGAAFLHLIEFGLPLPLLLASKIVTLAEFLAYGVLFSLFVYGKRLAQLGFFELCGASVAVLIGINQFPIIDFYTIDGLLFVGLAYVLLQRALQQDRLALAACAFASLGVATTLKQSFWFAPFAAFAWMTITRLAERRKMLARWVATAVLACASAPVLYVAYVTSRGGFSEMKAELIGHEPLWGDVLFDPFRRADLRGHLLPALVATVVLGSVIYLGARRGARSARTARTARTAQLFRVVDPAARALLTIVFLGVAVEDKLRFSAPWATRLWWCTVVVVILKSLSARRIDVPGVLVTFTAWMVTLSWGAPTPGLAAGACAVYVADAIWRDPPALAQRVGRPALAVAALVPTLVVAGLFVAVRMDTDYGVPRSSETELLGSLSSELSAVYADPAAAAYLRGVSRCSKRYPARWVAVVPEGVLAYPAFDLRNPFPIDWFWAPDYAAPGSRERLVSAASRVDADGDYLVLFQTAPIGSPPPTAPREFASFASDPTLASELAARLRHARRASCSQFIAYYRPAT